MNITNVENTNESFRFISAKEQKKHGCIYCTEVGHIMNRSCKRRICPHSVCPYANELDNYKSYEDYYKTVQERNEGLSFDVFSLFDYIPNLA